MGAAHPPPFLRFLYATPASFFPVFTSKKICFSHHFDRRKTMDIVFLGGAALLWGVTALLVTGFERLAQMGKGQPA
jgi:hypothetical protein